MLKSKYLVVLAFTMLFAGISCSDSDKENVDTNLTANIEIRLTDAPAPYDEVNIDILSLSIHIANEEFSGWKEFELTHPGVYNLLDFQNGIDTLLVESEINAGKISQIRLLLGENNTIVKDGFEYPLSTPSAQQSGLKFNFHDELLPGVTYRL